MSRRRWVIGICIIVLAVMAVLTSSLHDVHFRPGLSLTAETRLVLPLVQTVTETIQDTPTWKLLVIWLAFMVNLVLLFSLLPPAVRKRIFRQALRFATGLLILLIAIRYRVVQLPFLQPGPFDVQGQASPAVTPNLVVPEFHPPQMTPWIIYLISVGVLLVGLALVWAASHWWTPFRRQRSSALDAIAGIARSSLDDLTAGRDWGDVIVQSYIRMSEVISARRGLQRAAAMTPREFARRLEHAGLPTAAVGRLTGLFESVRYGGRKSTQSEVTEAVACLNSILHACGAAQ
jgi:hypothetical protein